MTDRRLVFLACLTAVACSDDENPRVDPFAATVTTVAIEIDYATGAAPYTGSAGRSSDIWQLSQTNLDRVFEGKIVDLPHVESDMQELTELSGEDFTTDAILDIADSYRDQPQSDAVATFYVVWLDGYFAQDGQRQTQVLGVTLGNTGVLAMFKPVIASAGSPVLPATERFVEQTTFIHEMGHAAGLVDNGIAPVTDHHDSENGAHCTNEDCVMYYLNEGVSDIADFASAISGEDSSVLFDADCLADLDAARE